MYNNVVILFCNHLKKRKCRASGPILDDRGADIVTPAPFFLFGHCQVHRPCHGRYLQDGNDNVRYTNIIR